MHRSRLLALIFALLAVLGSTTYAVTAAGADSSATVQDGRQQFVGHWSLAPGGFKAVTGTGAVIYPFGQDAVGQITYTTDGKMWAALWKANRPPFAVNDQQRGTPEEYTAAVQSYVQYFGTFDVDRAVGVINHRLVQSIFPNWNGTTQSRFYEFGVGFDTLVLSTPPIQFGGTTVTGYVSWVRMS